VRKKDAPSSTLGHWMDRNPETYEGSSRQERGWHAMTKEFDEAEADKDPGLDTTGADEEAKQGAHARS
jgi:hypothetical protein